MNIIRLAIVIPYFKIDYFEETIKSVAQQTDKRFILYIGNDKSPNDPLPIIEKYLQKEQYQYFDYQENYGGRDLTLQWERILNNVNEEWFQILGDDDVISANFVEEFYNHQTSIPTDINVIKIRNILCEENGERIVSETLYDNLPTGIYKSLDFLIRKFKGNVNSSLSEHIYRTKKYREIGFVHYPLAWHTDDMFFLQVSNHKVFYFIAQACVYIRVFSGSISGSDDASKLKIEASKRFFREFSLSLKENDISWYYKRLFLRSLRQKKRLLGKDYIKSVYYENDFFGRQYYKLYMLKLYFKNLLPTSIVLKIQGKG